MANPALPDQRAQPFGIDDLNRFAFDAQQPLDLEARQQATDGLQPKPEIAADVRAAHPQVKPRSGKSERLIAPPQVEKERSDPLLRPHGSQEDERIAVGLDLLIHQAVQPVLEAGDAKRQLLQRLERNLADFRIFEREGIR